MSKKQKPNPIEIDSRNDEQLALSIENTVAPICAIHRGEDSYIGFTSKRADGSWNNHFSLRPDELAAMFPAIAHWLVKDAYFTVNGMRRAAPYTNRATGLPDVWRKEQHLRYLNTCYVDLDVGRDCGTPEQQLTWRDAAAALGKMMDKGVLPQCSIFARSGRGVYVFWLLRAESDADAPHRCSPETLTLYKRVNREIIKRTKELASDPRAFDAARVLRVPGTAHGKCDNPATYMVQASGTGKPYAYTLRQLAAFFGVEELEISLPPLVRDLADYGAFTRSDEPREYDSTPSADERAQRAASREESASEVFGRAALCPGIAPQRVEGARARAALRAQDLTTIEHARGGWVKGRRAFSLELYASLLRAAGSDKATTLDALKIMASNCRPPFPSDTNDPPLKAILARAWQGSIKNYSNAVLVHWLQVTPDFAREFELRTILPDVVREERRPPVGGTRRAVQVARRAWLQAHIEANGLVSCSARRLREQLRNAGFEATHPTVEADLEALGFNSHAARPRAGRPAKNAAAAPDSLFDNVAEECS